MTLLERLIQRCETDPDYAGYTELFNRLDPTGDPEIKIVQRTPEQRAADNRRHRRIGILSGAFNPLTLAHTKIAVQTLAEQHLDEVILLLAKANVDKEVFGLPLAARLLTLKRYAMESGKNFSVGASSHGRYIDKVAALKAITPPDTEFHFIVGYDTFVRIFDPKYYTDFDAELATLFSAARLIVANRAEADIQTLKTFMAHSERRDYAPYVSFLLLPDVYAYMSSTRVRELLERGEAIEHLVPPSILTMLF